MAHAPPQLVAGAVASVPLRILGEPRAKPIVERQHAVGPGLLPPQRLQRREPPLHQRLRLGVRRRALRRRVGRHPDKAILGCTHYEIIAELFASALPAGTVLINQPAAVADALERYFARHPEYELGDSGRRDFLTTGQAGPQSEMVSQFWGAPLAFAQA